MILLSFILNNDDVYNYFKHFFQVINNRCGFYSRKTIIIEGKRCLKTSEYMTRTDSLFSDKFLAFWNYIANNNLNNQTIKCLKEFADSSNIFDNNGDSKNSRRSMRLFNNSNTNRDIFIVNQNEPFKINDDIYCKVLIDIEKLDDKKNNSIESIKVELYSYTLSLINIHNFVDNLNTQYKYELKKNRENKKYIYTLIGSGSSNNNNNYDHEIINSWEECEFNSTRNFKNLFFDKKKLLINKLNFFENNRQWYEYEGHPYTFGIGLHGPPGTGKTSIIKCIANKLNRHIIVIPLNKIKTQTEFSQYFFENQYNRNNTNSINFEDKIIVFEDIDCMSNIVKKRKSNNCGDTYNDVDDLSKNNENNENNKNNENFIIQNKLLNKIAKKIDEDHDDSMIINLDKDKNDKITLSFILNIIDGIRETPGRILIITSNNYNSLDPALIRPGRIDMTIEMRNADVDVIKEMYNHYYNDIIPEDIVNKFRDYVVSPAKIVNLRLQHENKDNFLNALVNEFK